MQLLRAYAALHVVVSIIPMLTFNLPPKLKKTVLLYSVQVCVSVLRS